MRARMLALILAPVALVAVLALRPSGGAAERSTTTRPGSSNLMPAEAAAQFLLGLDARTLLDAPRRRAYVGRWATRSAAPRLQRLYTTEASRLAALKGGYSRAGLIGYHVVRQTAATARVAIWAVSVASVGRLAPTVAWRTVAVDLRREQRRWRIDTVEDIPGPAFHGRPSAFRRQARQFRRFHVAP